LRRGSIFQIVLFGLIAAVAAGTLALVPAWLPTEASKEAGRIDFVFWFVTAICIGIFALVAAVIVFSVLKFRAQPDDDSDGPPIHGHTGLEIVWTAIPAALVVAIAIVSAVVLARNGEAGANSLRVDVTAQQFAWSFKYPNDGNVTSGTLRLPVNRSVTLHLTARDVIHSFWVPEFGQKQDTVPGLETTLVITPNRLGTYPVVCTELCGLGHAVMRTKAVVMTPAAFDAWAKRQSKAIGGGGATAGKAVFTENGCASCHTFRPAGANGKVGPDLDELKEAAEKAGKPLDDFVRESIVDPDAYVAPGFPRGVMPHTYAQLPKDQLDALVQYLTGSGKEGAA
jgi:cytochrome c oxidase subunit 2